jgi:ABC-2 type transport system ATP-binding protein
MIQVKDLQKSIDDKIILQDITFSIPKGSVVGVLGRNGAGKTTLLKILTGVLLPDKGSVYFEDFDIITNPEIKQKVAYVPDSPTILTQYKIAELVTFYTAIYPNFDKELFQELMERYKLPNKQIRNYSKGMKALLSIILAFCTKAEYIILDEPTSGLDPIVKRQILQFIIDEVSKHNTTVLISTHHLDEVEKIADTVIIINDHTVESITSLDDTKNKYSKIQVAFQEFMPHALEYLDNIEILSQIGRVYTVLIRDHVEETLTKFKDKNPLLLEELPMSLEDIFITTLGGDDYVA